MGFVDHLGESRRGGGGEEEGVGRGGGGEFGTQAEVGADVVVKQPGQVLQDGVAGGWQAAEEAEGAASVIRGGQRGAQSGVRARQEGFELLGEVLGAAEWGYEGNRLKLGRIWGRYGMKWGKEREDWERKGEWSQLGRKWGTLGTKGGPEWGLSCQEGFELLGGVLGVQNGVMGGIG